MPTTPQPAPSIGAWSTFREPGIAAAVAQAGFDWICVDEQHGAATPDATAAILDAVAGFIPAAYVRVAWNRPELIGRALDSGADGVIVPMVETVEDALAAARATRYPPLGGRSWGPRRSVYAGASGGDVAAANERVRCLVMVESAAALARVDELAAVDGVDGIFVGPFDLGIALGTSVDELIADTRPDSPLELVLAACRRHGRVAAVYAGSPERGEAFLDRGFDQVVVTSDAALLAGAADAAVAGFAAHRHG